MDIGEFVDDTPPDRPHLSSQQKLAIYQFLSSSKSMYIVKNVVYMQCISIDNIIYGISESSWGATQTNTHLWYIVLGDRVLNGDLILHYILQVISHSSPLCFQVSTPSSVGWFCLVF